MNEDELYIFNLSESELNNVPFDTYKWHCSHIGCNNGDKVRDFGISPFFRWKRKFVNLSDTILFCGKHNKMRKQNPLNFQYKEGAGIDHLTKLS